MTERSKLLNNTGPNREEKMKAAKRIVVCLFLAALSVAALSGCHTAQGFGEDMESAGQSIQQGTSK
jgi:predicted small secreted protein